MQIYVEKWAHNVANIRNVVIYGLQYCLLLRSMLCSYVDGHIFFCRNFTHIARLYCKYLVRFYYTLTNLESILLKMITCIENNYSNFLFCSMNMLICFIERGRLYLIKIVYFVDSEYILRRFWDIVGTFLKM